MKDLLDDIRPVVSIYVDILSRILKTNVTVVDENMHRIAVSNKIYKKDVSSRSDITYRAGILMQTIREAKPHIVEDPKESVFCANCISKEHCVEKYHMSAPIMVNGEVKGAMAFIATNNQQRDRMIKNHGLYRDFLAQFSNLVALKVQESIEKKVNLSGIHLLNEIVDHFNAGVLVFDKSGYLSRMNAIGNSIIGLEDPLPIKVEFDEIIKWEGYSEYLLKIKGQTYRLVGKLHPVYLDEYAYIFIFFNGIRTIDEENKRKNYQGLNRIIGRSSESLKIKNQIMKFANSKSPVLITGEGGTEKKEVALAIHEESIRSEQVFMALNCRSCSGEALERELMGVAAKSSSKGLPGLLEIASKGTVLLENIDCLPLSLQVKLKKVLEDGTFTRFRGGKVLKTGVRVIATTDKELRPLVTEGKFLEDLYYKLNVIPIQIPPLRERRGDIRLFAERFLKNSERKAGKVIVKINSDFWDAVSACPWNGNIWQLESSMEYVVNMMELNGEIGSELLPDNINMQEEKECLNLKVIEKRVIEEALRRFGADTESKQKVADELGIGIATLYRKMKQYGF